jgi:hypothetical protein
MNNDVELIVKTGSLQRFDSQSNAQGAVGSIRMIFVAEPFLLGLTGETLLVQNAAGESQSRTVTGVVADSPSAGFTRLNFSGDPAIYDFRLAAGGYFIYGVGGEYCLELYLNETISQNWRFSDLQTFAALGSFSRQFRVPATQNNCEVIGYLNDVNIDPDTNYLQVKLPAELRVQTLPIAAGYIRVMRVITQAGKLADFELTFYAESPDLFNKISGKKLKDIEALADLNAVLDYAEVVGASGYPYLYSLSDYGQKWDETGTLNSRSIYTATLFGAPRAGDLTPSLCWQWIFEKIITEAGFTYDAPNLEDVLFKYYAPWINAKSLSFVDTELSYLFKIYNGTSISMAVNVQYNWPTTGEEFDNGSTVLGNTFTAPVTGLYRFRFWYTFTSPMYYFGPNFEVYYQNVTTGGLLLINQAFIQAGTNNFDSVNGAPPFFLAAGDQFRLVYKTYVNGILLKPSAPYDSGTGLELLDIDFMDGATLNWSANAPDVTQSDFIKDVLNMHCCVLVPDRTIPNKLVIESIKDYVGTGTDRDWSKKLDISKDITLANTSDFQNKRLTFTYSAGEDMFSKIYTSIGRIYGDYKIQNYTVSEDDVPNDFAKDSEQKVQLTTQSTPSNYIDGTTIVIPKFVDTSGNFVSPKLRCLFYAGDVEMTLYDFSTFTPDTAYVAPILNHYEFIQPFFNSLDLNWAPEVPLYIQGLNPVNNLFNVYWRDYLNQLYSPNARIMECYLALDLADILSFTFADRIWITNAWWRILDISDYKVGSAEVTKVTLLKLIDAVPETTATPSGALPGGVVEFVDGTGAPTAPTQAACERFGYTWDPLTNSCFAFTSQPQNIQNAIGTKSTGTSTRQVSNADFTLVMADKLDNDVSNIYTTAVGTEIVIAKENAGSTAIGERLKKEGEGGVAMFGKNVFTTYPGMHFGGGYRDGNPSNTEEGWSQFGTIPLHKRATYTASAQSKVLDIQGIAGRYLNIPDDTAWSCVLNVMALESTAISYSYGAQINFTLMKTGGVASSVGPSVISANGNFGAYIFDINIDTVTDPDEHRIEMKVTGGTYPLNMIITASLTYQQIKLT